MPSASGVQETTSTVYDAAGNAIETIDALGYTTTYTYDALERQATEAPPTGGYISTYYDAANNVVRQTDELGYGPTNTYDALSRSSRSCDRHNPVQVRAIISAKGVHVRAAGLFHGSEGFVMKLG
jgi:YD repeat-containing protein